MRLLWISALKDLRRQLRDPLAVALWCGIPLLIALLMALAFGRGAGRTPQARLLVADEDGSMIGRLLVTALGQAGGLIVAEPVALEAGRRRLEEGEASALLRIPDGFGAAVLQRRPVTLELWVNPAQRVLPGIVEQTLSILVEAAFYAQETLAEPLRLLAAAGPLDQGFPDSDQVAAVAVGINEAIGRARPVLDPPLIQVETHVDAGPARPNVSLGSLLFPGTLLMGLMFVAQGMSEDVWREKRLGTLRRALASPCRVTAFVGGKLLAAAAFVALVSAIALAAGAALFGLEASRLPLALVWCTFSGAALFTLFVVLQLLASTQRAGSVLTSVVVYPLLMIGGSFFPFEAMPRWMAAVGRYTPNGWALSVLKQVLAGTADPAAVGAAFVGLTVVSAALFAAAALRVRRSFA